MAVLRGGEDVLVRLIVLSLTGPSASEAAKDRPRDRGDGERRSAFVLPRPSSIVEGVGDELLRPNRRFRIDVRRPLLIWILGGLPLDRESGPSCSDSSSSNTSSSSGRPRPSEADSLRLPPVSSSVEFRDDIDVTGFINPKPSRSMASLPPFMTWVAACSAEVGRCSVKASTSRCFKRCG
jgi:hypothetical protein